MLSATIAVTVSVKIYTKNGDSGKSKTLTGQQKAKSDLLFEVLGTIDELNASLGFLQQSKKRKLAAQVTKVQSDLFKLGSFIAGSPMKSSDVVWITARVAEIETAIDEIDTQNKPLKNFILPGGSVESAQLHFARTICRRLERTLVAYLSKVKTDQFAVCETYFNRLSDLLFVLARFYNNKGNADVIWKP